jgi:Ser/Thr protein kinase RdoA (MazF antagonist)
MTNLVINLPSYINRVYEVRVKDNTKLIAKFYRPGRWTKQAIQDEHNFLLDCVDADLPVVAPLKLPNNSTIEEYNGIFLSIFPKRAGRQLEITSEEYWPRIGSLLGRMHVCGEKKKALNRITISPVSSARNDVDFLCSNSLPDRMRESFRSIGMKLLDASAPLFENQECIRIHGDCHRGNILDRMDEGLLLIDFDDMAMGPPVQDLWLLLPDRVDKCGLEIELLLEGYQRFKQFNRKSLKCVESLRAMRMIYFLAWCSKQTGDFVFKRNFPDWGSDPFWQKEINDLREQLGFVMEAGQEEEYSD